MSAHVHDPAAPSGDQGPLEPVAGARDAPAAPARWWLRPALVGALAVGALVVAGILPPSTVFYAALLGGCVLMHLVGHGGHGRHGRASEEPATTDVTNGESAAGDQHGSRGCH